MQRSHNLVGAGWLRFTVRGSLCYTIPGQTFQRTSAPIGARGFQNIFYSAEREKFPTGHDTDEIPRVAVGTSFVIPVDWRTQSPKHPKKTLDTSISKRKKVKQEIKKILDEKKDKKSFYIDTKYLRNPMNSNRVYNHAKRLSCMLFAPVQHNITFSSLLLTRFVHIFLHPRLIYTTALV